MARQETIDSNLRYAKAEYVEGNITIAVYERAVEHVLAGGMGCEEFPFLPAFEALPTEAILE